MDVGLSLGSNLGDRLATLREARRQIGALPDVREIACSPVYETEPVGVRPEYHALAYLNVVIILDSTGSVDALSDALHAIEAAMGRVREDDRFAPRPIDIDILYAGEVFSDRDDLTLPHPRWAERRFVVQPLADVRPDLVLPGTVHRVRDILAALPPAPAVRRHTPNDADW